MGRPTRNSLKYDLTRFEVARPPLIKARWVLGLRKDQLANWVGRSSRYSRPVSSLFSCRPVLFWLSPPFPAEIGMSVANDAHRLCGTPQFCMRFKSLDLPLFSTAYLSSSRMSHRDFDQSRDNGTVSGCRVRIGRALGGTVLR